MKLLIFLISCTILFNANVFAQKNQVKEGTQTYLQNYSNQFAETQNESREISILNEKIQAERIKGDAAEVSRLYNELNKLTGARNSTGERVPIYDIKYDNNNNLFDNTVI